MPRRRRPREVVCGRYRKLGHKVRAPPSTGCVRLRSQVYTLDFATAEAVFGEYVEN